MAEDTANNANSAANGNPRETHVMIVAFRDSQCGGQLLLGETKHTTSIAEMDLGPDRRMKMESDRAALRCINVDPTASQELSFPEARRYVKHSGALHYANASGSGITIKWRGAFAPPIQRIAEELLTRPTRQPVDVLTIAHPLASTVLPDVSSKHKHENDNAAKPLT